MKTLIVELKAVIKDIPETADFLETLDDVNSEITVHLSTEVNQIH